MAQMSITAKIQVVASDEDKALLDETMSIYREACNYVSDYVFRTHDLKQFSLNKGSAERCEVVVFVYTLEACDNNYVVAVNLGT